MGQMMAVLAGLISLYGGVWGVESAMDAFATVNARSSALTAEAEEEPQSFDIAPL